MKPYLKKSRDQNTIEITGRMVFAMKRILMSHSEIRTRTAYAEQIHTRKEAISLWESGEARCTLENVADACKVFGFSYEWMMAGKGEMFGNAELIVRLQMAEKRLQEMDIRLLAVEKRKK